jgi:hypothetical protein
MLHASEGIEYGKGRCLSSSIGRVLERRQLLGRLYYRQRIRKEIFK